MKAASFKCGLAFWQSIALGILSSGLLPTLAPHPVQGAERITLSYGIVQQSISVDALERYVATGTVEDELGVYTRHVSQEQIAQLRQVLQTRISLNSQQLSQLLDTPIGNQLIHRLATLIQSDDLSRSNAAIRVAMIQAAADPNGLTVLNVLRQFPASQIEIDLLHSLNLIAELKALNERTDQLVAQVNQQAKLKASDLSLSAELTQTDLQQQSRFTWKQHTLTLTDHSRRRTIPVNLYLPVYRPFSPVIVISHGLSSDRASFAYLAQHLATYGFAVAVPEHPGSNWKQLFSVFEGKAGRITSPHEFIDRPLDVTFLLNELGRLQSNPIFQERLNLERVGVMGQSFGGYTGLVLAGAAPNFEELESTCQTSQIPLNPSLLLQCQALALPQRHYDLADSRVKAVMAISPIASHILGQASLSQINLPVLMTASSRDALTPVLVEQFYPFSWLTTSNKYLALLNGATHFSSIAPPKFSLHQGTDSQDAIARRYMAALSAAFFQTHLADQPGYRPYLSAAYTNAISDNDLRLSLVQALSIPQIKQASKPFTFSKSLIFIGTTAQAIGVVYFIAVRQRLRVCTRHHGANQSIKKEM
jgi:predicted dienelactone hydrolase